MPTIPTGEMERELRKLYLRWLSGVAYDSRFINAKIDSFERSSTDLIEKLGGQTASLGAYGDFPTPKRLDLSPHVGTIYNDMHQAAIQAGIMAGLNSTQVARDMFNAGMDKSFNRLNRLARTETVSAYWKNAWDSVADLPLLVMVWGSEDGPRTCAWCRERDGLVMEDSGLRDHPNGRCTPIPMLRTKVDYRGSVRRDGEIYIDDDWGKKQAAAKPAVTTVTKDELEAYTSWSELNKFMGEKQNASVSYFREMATKYGREALAEDATYLAMQAEMKLIIARMQVLRNAELAVQKAEQAAKGLAKVGVHPKVDKLPAMPAAPSSLDTAYAAGKANPNGVGWFNAKKGGVNFSFNSDRDYQINCTRVAYATEMRMRGKDVTAAKAGAGANKSDVAIQANWVDPATGKARSLRKTGSEAILMREMLKAPEGSRFFVVGPWKQGGAHIWNAEKKNGQIIFHEGQVYNAASGTEAMTRSYLNDLDFERFKGTGSSVRFMRVDDLEPTDWGVTRGWLEVDGKVVTK